MQFARTIIGILLLVQRPLAKLICAICLIDTNVHACSAIIIIIRQPLCPVVVRKASACRLQITLSCAVLCHIVSLQYLSRSSLHRLAVLSCRLFLSYGLQVVTCEVHRLFLRRLICPAQDLFFPHSVHYIYVYMPLSSPWPICWSFYRCMWCSAYFSPFWSVRPQVCPVLVWSVSRSLHHIS